MRVPQAGKVPPAGANLDMPGTMLEFEGRGDLWGTGTPLRSVLLPEEMPIGR